MRRPSAAARRLLVLPCCALLAVTGLPPAGAQDFASQTYVGEAYSDALLRTPTATENQSKIWFHAEAWWAVMVDDDSRTARVHELMQDHTWRATSTVITDDVDDVGDALLDGNTTHVLVRESDDEMQYVKLTFDPTTREYTAAPSRRVTRRGSDAVPSIAQDTAGRLWVAFATVRKIFYAWSDDGGRNWSDLALLATTGTGGTPEQAALVSYDDRVGVLWSDQGSESFEFASHRDGDVPTTWTYERAIAGPGLADNHLSLRRLDGQPQDTLVAAVKTSLNDRGQSDGPIIQVLIRTGEGRWTATPVATVADLVNDPVLVLNDATRTMYVFASSAGDIVMKSSPVDTPAFEPGKGELFALGTEGPLIDPSVPKESVTGESGIVVLASDDEAHVYHHAEMPLQEATALVDPDDATPPGPPGVLRGRALSENRVVLSWTAASDGDRWLPAREGVPVAEYVVERDGVEVTTPSTSFEDRIETTPGDKPPTRVEYRVYAVDLAGNRSEAAELSISLPSEESSWNRYTVGLGLFLVALAAIGLFLWRRRQARFALETHPVERRDDQPVFLD